jgi:type IV pilus assembly protein PilQ
MNSKTAFIGLFSLALVGVQACSSTQPQVRSGGKPQMVKDISVSGFPDYTEVTVETEGLVTYTAFRLGEPERLVIDLPGTTLGSYSDEITVNEGALVSIRPIEGEDPSYVSRLELFLQSESESRVRAEGNKLVVDIEKPIGLGGEMLTEAPAAGLSDSKETQFEAADAGMEKPEESMPPEMTEEALLVEEAAPPVEVVEAMEAEEDIGDLSMEEPSEPKERLEAEPFVPESSAGATVVSSVTVEPGAEMTQVIISGDGELIAEVFRVGKDRLVTDLKGVANAVRPNAFKVAQSPVTQVRIGEHKDPKKVRVVLDLKRDVEYDVDEMGSQIILYVRAVASAPPRTEAVAESAPVTPPAAPKAQKAPRVEPAAVAPAKPSDPTKKFSGRKISLDFQDADLTDVLRLMADVSGLNVIVGPTVSGKVTLKLLNVPWDQALDIVLRMNNLGQIREGNILQIDTLANIAKQRAAEAQAKAEGVKAEDLVTQIIAVNYADANELAGPLQKNLSPRGSITIDERTNSMIVKDIDQNLKEVVEMTRLLDTQTPQVLIEARIVQADRSFARSLGIMWGFGFTDTGSNNLLGVQGGATGPFGAPAADFAVNLPGAVPGLEFTPAAGFTFGRFTDNPFNLDLRLSAGELSGVTKTISSPRVITLDNTEAKIEQGESIPFQTTSLQGTQTTFVDANLVLQVTPHVTADESILLKVRAARNSLGSFSGPAGPSIARREASTEILLKNGETTVIGGIFVDEQATTHTGIPWLSKIPVIGWLFKSKTETDTKNELLIFLTPRILES